MATNTLGVYNPIFYANEALIQLEKALGMASRVYRGFEDERNARTQGQVISIRKPATFTAAAAPSVSQDLATETVNITLDQWYEVKFELTDKELAYTGERIIQDHIKPAAYALADNVDAALNALQYLVPWYVDAAGSASCLPDLTSVNKVLFDNRVPMNDGLLHLEVDGTQQAWLQQLPIFYDAAVRGAAGGTGTMLRGGLGNAMGLEVFANQNVASHVKGTLNDAAPLIKGSGEGATAVGAVSITMDKTSLTGTMTAGDTFTVAGDTQRYAVNALCTAGSNEIVVTFSPASKAIWANNAVVAVSLDDHTSMIGFHRNAFALAMAPLPDNIPNQLGAQVATVQDPVTGLAIRSRMYYIGDSSKVVVALDILYGVKVLDPNLAVLLRG